MNTAAEIAVVEEKTQTVFFFVTAAVVSHPQPARDRECEREERRKDSTHSHTVERGKRQDHLKPCKRSCIMITREGIRWRKAAKLQDGKWLLIQAAVIRFEAAVLTRSLSVVVRLVPFFSRTTAALKLYLHSRTRLDFRPAAGAT